MQRAQHRRYGGGADSERDDALASGMNGSLTTPMDARRLHDMLVNSLACAS